ncbi:uncharacterized protein LOC142230364 [Haematobia irritans]|uniref:uncharacterized protein LOC142230364 n=1 Tax=Haematobia irritans TaxID=7368 RepID=UPI003F50518F
MLYFYQFVILSLIAITNGDYTNGDLYCVKCQTRQHTDCTKTQLSVLYNQKCPEGFGFCTIIRDENDVVIKGCSNGTACDKYKAIEESECCSCEEDFCNETFDKCNDQIELKFRHKMEAVLIVLSLLFCI